MNYLFALDIILADLYSVKHGTIPALGGKLTEFPVNLVTTMNRLRIYRYKAFLNLTVYSLYEILW